MNIKQAKQYIKDIVKIYLKKDEYGEYRVPVVRQRPVFLLGAPGVGKTAIMEQIASELDIALVDYSMTHHTRQSALGLPFIVHREYDGKQVDITEYTMSEIISSVYDVMEKSGIREGILFLDEINCVSETLSPAMLQFLQFKTFGRYSVPDGWVIVTAGNPPEYNKSVREFDVVTLDRMKLMEVEPDYSVWKEYAYDKRLHGAVTSYLENNKDDFYQVETTVRGRGYVTARGWEDLSQIITMYEEEELTVDESLIGQYLRNERIVREFSAYYDLYKRYVSDYAVSDIIRGTASEYVYDKASAARLADRLALVGILADNLCGRMRNVCDEAANLEQIYVNLKSVKTSGDPIAASIDSRIALLQTAVDKKRASGAYNDGDRFRDRSVIEQLKSIRREISDDTEPDRAGSILTERFEGMKSELEVKRTQTTGSLESVLGFCEKAFGEGNELVLLLTRLTTDKDSAAYLARFGSDKYSELAGRLLIKDPSSDIMKKIENLDL